MARTLLLFTFLSLALTAPVAAQDAPAPSPPMGAPGAQSALTLSAAVARARQQHPDVRIAASQQAQAAARVGEARAALLPRVDLSEGWQSGTAPVFAFSSLLSQRRFSSADFDVARLNHPGRVDNFRSAVTLEQPVFDAVLRAGHQSAGLAAESSRVWQEQVARQVTVDTVEAYGRVLLLDALARAADAAVRAADEDLRRAGDRRDAGVATNADVLSASVHLAAMRERGIQVSTEAGVARARLNHLMGEPLDASFALEPPPVPPAAAPLTAEDETHAARTRADVRIAELAERISAVNVASTRAAFLPRVVARGAAEWNGATYGSRAAGWVVGAEVQMNLFRGLGDRARLAAARSVHEERGVARVAAEDRARLEIRGAAARVASAAARVDVSRPAVEAARESQRITRDRYDNGLASMSSVLDAGRMVLDAEAQAVAAETDRVIEHARLEAALGRL